MRLRRIEPILRRALRGPCRLPEGSRLLVAVSGGADSTALLVGLASVAREFGLSLSAAHLHHGLRGAEADGDLEFVRGLCERLGVPLEAGRLETEPPISGRMTSEARLRTQRQFFLWGVAHRLGAAKIATAHTADDQLETVLMRLARGTGLRGLGGMAPAGSTLKPLLEATRYEIELDLRAAGIEWREDSSNASRAYLRNRLRHDVVPALLAAIAGPDAGPLARAKLARRAAATAADARAGALFARRMASPEYRRRTTRPIEDVIGWDQMDEASREAIRARPALLRTAQTIDVSDWAALDTAVRHALLASFWAVATNGRYTGLSRQRRDALDALLLGKRRRAELHLTGGWVVVLHRPRLSIWPGLPSKGRAEATPDGKLRRTAGSAESASSEPSRQSRSTLSGGRSRPPATSR